MSIPPDNATAIAARVRGRALTTPEAAALIDEVRRSGSSEASIAAAVAVIRETTSAEREL